MPNTKSFQKFANRVASMKQTFQLTDLALSMSQKHCMKNAGQGKKLAEIMKGSLLTHRQLNIPDNKRDIQRTFVTNRSRLNQQALIDIYRAFSYYIKNVIVELSHQNPLKMQGLLCNKAEKSMTYPDIINLGSYDAIIKDMANKVFRSLENLRSTTDMLDKLLNLTRANIDQSIKEDALLFLNLRHLIIHNNSRADDKFIAANNRGLVNVNPLNKKISYNYSLSNTAMNVVYQLCKQFDDEIVRLGLV